MSELPKVLEIVYAETTGDGPSLHTLTYTVIGFWITVVSYIVTFETRYIKALADEVTLKSKIN